MDNEDDNLIANFRLEHHNHQVCAASTDFLDSFFPSNPVWKPKMMMMMIIIIIINHYLSCNSKTLSTSLFVTNVKKYT